MAEIKTIGLWRDKRLDAGSGGTSNPVDCRNLDGYFSVAFRARAGTAGTAGTTVFTYSGASTEEGTYVTPSNAVAIGTCGTGVTGDIAQFNPNLMPWMRIIATQTGSGNNGKDSIIDAELIVQ